MNFDLRKVKPGKLKTREFVICIFTLSFVLLSYFVALRGAQKDELLQVLAMTQKEQQELSPKQTKFLKLNRQPSSAKIDSSFQGNRNFSDLIQKLSGADHAYRVNRLHLEKFEERNNLAKSSYVLEIESTFVQLSTLIEQLEASNFQVEITKVEVARMNKDLRQCTAKIFLNSFTERGDL